MKRVLCALAVLIVAGMGFAQGYESPIAGVYEIMIYPENVYDSETGELETVNWLLRAAISNYGNMVIAFDNDGDWSISDHEMINLNYTVAYEAGFGYYASAWMPGEGYSFFYDPEIDRYTLIIRDTADQEYIVVPMMWVGDL